MYKKNFFQSQRLITKYGDCLLCSTNVRILVLARKRKRLPNSLLGGLFRPVYWCSVLMRQCIDFGCVISGGDSFLIVPRNSNVYLWSVLDIMC